MEATATWAEDEVYDDVNDNRQYLADSPLTQPQQLDRPLRRECRPVRRLDLLPLPHRAVPRRQGRRLPTLVRDIWERADGAAGGPDDYSIQAVDRELRARGTTLPHGARRGSPTPTGAPRLSYGEGSATTTRPHRSRAGSQPAEAGALRLAPSAARPPRQPPPCGIDPRARRCGAGASGSRSTCRPAPAAPARGHGVPRLAGGRRPPDGRLDAQRRRRTSRSPSVSHTVRHVEVTLVNAGIRLPLLARAPPTPAAGRSRDDDLTVQRCRRAARSAELRAAELGVSRRRAGSAPGARRPGRWWSTSAAGWP